MALGRNPSKGGTADVRDVEDDYLQAQIREHAELLQAGYQERANRVAVELRARGYEVDKAPTGVKERAVSEPVTEKAVDDDAPLESTSASSTAETATDEEPARPRRGRPPKTSTESE